MNFWVVLPLFIFPIFSLTPTWAFVAWVSGRRPQPSDIPYRSWRAANTILLVTGLPYTCILITLMLPFVEVAAETRVFAIVALVVFPVSAFVIRRNLRPRVSGIQQHKAEKAQRKAEKAQHKAKKAREAEEAQRSGSLLSWRESNDDEPGNQSGIPTRYR